MYFQLNFIGSPINYFVFNRLALVSFFFISSYACAYDSPSTDVLQGKWLLVAADRGGVPTTTLKDAYFSFLGDTLLRTNLLQEDQEYVYSFDGKKIVQSGSTNITYDVLHLQEDTMVLNANIRKYDFTFLLIRDSLELFRSL